MKTYFKKEECYNSSTIKVKDLKEFFNNAPKLAEDDNDFLNDCLKIRRLLTKQNIT